MKGYKSPTYGSLVRITPSDAAYLFPVITGDERRVQGKRNDPIFKELSNLFLRSDVEGIHVGSINRFPNMEARKFVFGAPGFDKITHRTKYELWRLNEGEIFPEEGSAYLLNGMSIYRAREAEKEIAKELILLSDKISIETEIKEICPSSFVVLAAMRDVDDENPHIQNLERAIESVLSKMGTEPKIV